MNVSECDKKEVLADMIKLKILRWEEYPGLSRWTLNATTCVLIQARQREIWHYLVSKSEKRRRRCEDKIKRDLKMLALKIEVMWLQAREYQRAPEAGRNEEQISFPDSPREHGPANPLILAQ